VSKFPRSIFPEGCALPPEDKTKDVFANPSIRMLQELGLPTRCQTVIGKQPALANGHSIEIKCFLPTGHSGPCKTCDHFTYRNCGVRNAGKQWYEWVSSKDAVCIPRSNPRSK
jgi:hypothetical protein